MSMLAIDRHKQILAWLRNEGSITVREASERLEVSQVTARRDIDDLASKGLLVRTRGGAVLKGVGTTFEPLYNEKRSLHHELKKRIAEAAAELVQDGETVILDSGSTSYEMVPSLKKRKNLTVITYDLMIAVRLATDSEVNVIVAGGIVRNNLYSVKGTPTVEMLSKLHANKTFLTADAVDLKRGITNATVEGTAIKETIIEAADEVILIADHSKFGRCSLAQVAGLERVDLVITDDGLPSQVAEGLREKGIPLQMVGGTVEEARTGSNS